MGMIDDFDDLFVSAPERTPKLKPEPEPAKSYIQFESRKWLCYLCGRLTNHLMTYRSEITWRLAVCPICAERWCDGPKTRANLLETE